MEEAEGNVWYDWKDRDHAVISENHVALESSTSLKTTTLEMARKDRN